MLARNVARAVEDECDAFLPWIFLLALDAAPLLLEQHSIRCGRLGDALRGQPSDVDTIHDAGIEDIDEHEVERCRQHCNVRQVQAAR